jgi:D-3-phosphoglycerate dehydrogenase
MSMLDPRAEVKIAPDVSPHTLRNASRVADVIVVRANLPQDIFENATRLRGVVRHGVGLDMIPMEAASRHGIVVANTPNVNVVAVAEYVIGQMIMLARRLHTIDQRVREEGWDEARGLSDRSTELAGRTVGIVGMGAIGTEVARMCHYGLRMRVLGYRRSTAKMPSSVTAVSLDVLFSEADVVVLACPLNPQSRGLANSTRLGLMKPSAHLINVSRGPVVDEHALCDALARNKLAGAALDVFESQPLSPASPLFTLPNVILSTHLAGITRESMKRMSELAAEQVLSLLDGTLPKHFVNVDIRESAISRLRRLGSI